MKILTTEQLMVLAIKTVQHLSAKEKAQLRNTLRKEFGPKRPKLAMKQLSVGDSMDDRNRVTMHQLILKLMEEDVDHWTPAEKESVRVKLAAEFLDADTDETREKLFAAAFGQLPIELTGDDCSFLRACGITVE